MTRPRSTTNDRRGRESAARTSTRLRSGSRRAIGRTGRPELIAAIPRLVQRRHKEGLDDATFAALYFLHWQIATCGAGFAARRHKGDPAPQADDWLDKIVATDRRALPARLYDYLEGYQFRGVSAAALMALCRWLQHRWPLVLCETVPSALEVLRAQARGARVVTAISAYPRMLDAVLAKPDAFAFFLHDLEHAYKFFYAPALHAAQRAFFEAIEAAFDRGVFAPYGADPAFMQKFDYLISDMNTHPQHGRQYLRAILIDFYLRRDAKPSTATLPPAARRDVEDVVRAVETSAQFGAGA